MLQIPEGSVRRQVVSTCTSFATLMDCLTHNNKRLVELEQYEERARLAEVAKIELDGEVERCLRSLREYAQVIRAAHVEASSGIATLSSQVRNAFPT